MKNNCQGHLLSIDIPCNRWCFSQYRWERRFLDAFQAGIQRLEQRATAPIVQRLVRSASVQSGVEINKRHCAWGEKDVSSYHFDFHLLPFLWHQNTRTEGCCRGNEVSATPFAQTFRSEMVWIFVCSTECSACFLEGTCRVHEIIVWLRMSRIFEIPLDWRQPSSFVLSCGLFVRFQTVPKKSSKQWHNTCWYGIGNQNNTSPIESHAGDSVGWRLGWGPPEPGTKAARWYGSIEQYQAQHKSHEKRKRTSSLCVPRKIGWCDNKRDQYKLGWIFESEIQCR